MTCIVKLYEKPQLNDPVLIEGLPGIGLVANLATSHLVKELNARLFGEIFSSSFQDAAVTAAEGEFRSPMARLYYHRGKDGGRDLILLHGNAQALTTRGQYELCWRILEVVEELGCKLIITLGGYRPGGEVRGPRLYYAVSDLETAHEVENIGAEILSGQIFGVAGLLIGLCELRKMKGFCLLAETTGDHPDKAAAKEILKVLARILELNLNLSADIAVDESYAIGPFDLKALPYKREVQPEWFI